LPDVVNEHSAHSLNKHVWSPIMVCTHPTFMAVTDHKVHSVFTDHTWLFGCEGSTLSVLEKSFL